MDKFSLAESADAMRARPIGDVSGDALRVCSDTRTDVTRSLFFALKGENFDGHKFVRQAFEMGAAAAVVQRFIEVGGLPQLIVTDTTLAFGYFAKWYRSKFELPVIGITGSVGKTSTKEMIAHTLSGRLNVLMSEKNFNNEIGVPQTLLQLERDHQAAVIEMGMRGAGQVAHLADIAAPNIGVITNIGLSHIELLGSREQIARAKSELIEALPATGFAIINADDSFADFLASKTPATVLTYGTSKGAAFRATHVKFNSNGEPTFRINGKTLTVNAPGVHHVTNAAATCAAVSGLGIELEEVASRLQSFHPPAMRMELVELADGTTVINDSYNAAPDSMRSALETLSVMAGSHRRAVAVLGEMKELGAESESGHRYVGEQVVHHKPALLLTVGKMAGWIADSASEIGKRRIHEFPDTQRAVAGILKLVKPGDLILVKGSRAMSMEKIVAALAKGNQ